MIKNFKITLSLLSAFLFTGTLFTAPVTAAGPVRVFVSIVPQKYFVQQIGKELVDVQAMVMPGNSPAVYEPRPGQMAALSKAKLYFSVGVPFEKRWLKKIASTNPRMSVVHTEHGIQKMPMPSHLHGEAGPGGKDGHRDQGILDPHIWTSPPLVMIQARNILTALQSVDPAHRAEYETWYKAFVSELLDLDARLRNIFAGRKGLQFMVFHPAWGYFAHTYGLKQVPIELEGKNPKPAQLKEIIEHARANKIKVIFVQPQFSSRSARQVAKEIGGQVVFADPLAENWMENLRLLAKKFDKALR